MSAPDLTWKRRGMWIDFTPETPAGETAWNTMAAQGGATILCFHRDAVVQQLRAAGYIVRKAGKPEPIGMTDDELLAALNA
jgi:hypothetical protein